MTMSYYLDLAKQQLDRSPDDPAFGYIVPDDVKQSYEYLRKAWLIDVSTSEGGGGGGGGTAVGTYSVKDYGAVGDGETDDTDAIMACITAAGDGGYIFFPDGVYVISRPLIPKTGQRLEGTWQTYYAAGIHPSRPLSGRQGSVIYASQEFVGEGMIMCAQYTYGVHITRLGIIGPGPGHSSGCHGVKLPTRSQNTGETSWWVEECLINSMPGHGITGHMWVFDARDTHISQCSWGLAVTGNDGMLDTRIIGCMFYFNRDGGFLLDGGWTGAIEIIGCRVERSGNLYGYPSTPVNPYAPGVRIRRGQQVILTNVSTDANTGPGLWIGHPTATVYNILLANCAWARDGGGTQEIKEWWAWVDGVYQQVEQGHPDATTVSGEGIPGVWFDRCFDVKMVNNVVSYGKHDDSDDVDGPIGPGIAFKANNTWQCEVSSTRFETIPFERSLDIDDTNSRLDVHLPQHSLMKVPVAGEAKWLPKMKQIGLVAYQNDLQSLVVQNYNGDWVSMVSYDPRYNHVRLPYSVEVRDRVGDRLSQVKFTKGGDDDVDGWGLLRWGVGVNPDSTLYAPYTFFIGRYGDDGEGNTEAYIDDPLSINYATGRVDLNHTYLRSRSPDDITLIVRGYEDQTFALQEWWSDSAIDGASTVAGVRVDGRIWGSDATSGSDFVTLDQLENAVSGGGTDVEFAQYTGSETRDKRLEFRTRDSVTGEVIKLWQMGVNPRANGNTFYVYRTDDTGAYLDSPIAINRVSGRVNLNRAMISNELDPTNTVLYVRATDPLQTGPLIDADVDGVTMFQVSATGQVTAADGTDDDHLVTKAQLDSALSGGGSSPSLTLDGAPTVDKRIAFETDGLLRWQMGVNPANAFYIWRADDNGDYLDSVLTVNPTTGALSTNQQFIETTLPSAVPLQVVGAPGQTASMLIIKDSVGGLLAGVSADGRVWGSNGVDTEDYVTKGQLDAAVSGGTSSTGLGPLVPVTGSEVQDKAFRFVTKDSVTEVETLQWQMGVNSSGTFYIWRPDALGAYYDTPLSINRTTGVVTTGQQVIDTSDPAAIPLRISPATAATASTLRVESSSGGALLEVLSNGKVQTRWGSNSFAVVQQGCTQIVREGATGGQTLLAGYPSTAAATADNSVFEVYGNGSVKCAPARDDTEAINLGQLQRVVANASSWEDFQWRVAALPAEYPPGAEPPVV